MSSAEKAQASQAKVETREAGRLDAFLDQMPKHVDKGKGKDQVQTFVDTVMEGTLTFEKSVSNSINRAIAKIDEKISKQLAAIMHAPRFQELEGSWRGLRHLVYNSETNDMLKIRVLNASKRDLFKDFEKALDFDQSLLFQKIYENEFGMPGGQPYGALIGDYQFYNHPEEIGLLTKLSGVAAAAFCPFISSAGPAMFGLESMTELRQPLDMRTLFDGKEFIQWKAFRESEDSRFVVLTMPRVLARLPWGKNTKTVDEFGYEEVKLGPDGKPVKIDHTQYCWMNAAYVLGQRLTDAFSRYGWCTAIRGAQDGGKVDGLPVHVFTSDDGDLDQKCPTEIAITDRREKELSDVGFLPLCHYKDTDYAVFFGAQTAQKPKKYEGKDGIAATENAAISARLPYIMASSRIAHYLKVIARDKIGGFMEKEDCQTWLENWIANYVCVDPKPSDDMKKKFPLAAAKIEVENVPGSPGSYKAIAFLRPWLQFEELTASIRMVASLPAATK
jgi:type VI secretion system protein ImpC